MISLRLCLALLGVGFVGGFIYELKTTPARTSPPAIEHQDEGTLALMKPSQQTESGANCE
ncbi:MAG: hypothetical protein HC895_01345 [Leptolyngbyaceae cyanobacterium SM1_3_5]|nr:hypothetical protein [Leptolyngbyaceae cyanobacterium SM1_3_5]